MLKSITIRREGAKVLLLSGGILIAELPWQAADELAVALRAKARQAEEEENGESIAYDSAILMRAGVPFSLSSRADILKEAMKEAAWNSNLRRYMPGSVKSQEVFGLPAIKHSTRESVCQTLSPQGVSSCEIFGKV